MRPLILLCAMLALACGDRAPPTAAPEPCAPALSGTWGRGWQRAGVAYESVLVIDDETSPCVFGFNYRAYTLSAENAPKLNYEQDGQMLITDRKVHGPLTLLTMESLRERTFRRDPDHVHSDTLNHINIEATTVKLWEDAMLLWGLQYWRVK